MKPVRQIMLLAAALGLALLLQAAPPPAAEARQGAVTRKISLGLSYVQSAQVIQTGIHGLTHKTLCIQFKRPLAVLSTLEGYKTGVKRAANHYVPHGAWKTLSMQSVPQLMDTFWASHGFTTKDGAMLITGADMDHLVLKQASHKGTKVVVLVTAGVRGNAMRMGFDQGKHLEPGTINAIILTNRGLSPRAMTRAMISATEAKTAAMQDLDVRSSYQPRKYQATGTGTDNIIVVQGEGPAARLSGGHTKLGELIARAMYAGVIQAIARQNRLLAGRGAVDRLKERKVSLSGAEEGLIADQPFFSSFMEQAMALDDAWRRGLLKDLGAWQELCEMAAGRCAHAAPGNWDQAKGPLAMALEAVRSCGPKPASRD